jgi:hypothetical protein
MKRFFRVVVAAGAVAAVLAGVATAGSVKGTGGGWVGFFDTSVKYVQFSLSAHEGPNGDFGQTQFTITDEFGFPLDLRAKLDCVHVFAQPPFRGTMWASGIVTSVDDPTGTYFIFPGDTIYVSAFDGGDPSATAPVDDFEVWYDLHVSCKSLDANVEPPDVTQGNIVIDDSFTL